MQWQPKASLDDAKKRALLLENIRLFFKDLNVLEVETPLLCQYGATATHIESIAINLPDNTARFLQTSPEYAMKRLLAAGYGNIFQICKAFRWGEQGGLHNPEFSMLEWYRINFSLSQLMQETIALLHFCGINYNSKVISYRELFQQYINLDPANANLSELQNIINNKINLSNHFKQNLLSIASCQELLFSNLIEPNLEPNIIWVIYNYPKEQRALAKIIKDPDGSKIAQRFEVYINNLELANGYQELLDPKEQYDRFIEDQELRDVLGKTNLAIDPYLLEALQQGLPECSGIAVGLDRLLAVLVKSKTINKLLTFPWDIA